MSRIENNRSATLLALSLALSGTSALAAPESYTLDPTHSYPYFSVSHLGFSTMQGRFDKTGGKVLLDQAAKTASIDVTIDTASINTGLQKRDDHLRSPDFFNTAEFPKATYKSTAVKFNGNVPATIEGNLTLLGVTRPVTLTVATFKCGPNPMNQKPTCGVNATGTLKRSDFGMKYALPAVGDDITLAIAVEGVRD